MKKISAEWIEKAEGDFKVAARESEADDAVYDVVCYHCQQVADCENGGSSVNKIPTSPWSPPEEGREEEIAAMLTTPERIQELQKKLCQKAKQDAANAAGRR